MTSKRLFQDFSEREIPDELLFKEKESKIEIMFRRTELWMSHNCTHIPFLGIRIFLWRLFESLVGDDKCPWWRRRGEKIAPGTWYWGINWYGASTWYSVPLLLAQVLVELQNTCKKSWTEKCLKDPTYAIFLKSWGFKDVKNDIPMCQYHSTRPQPIQLVPTMQKKLFTS